ncbi:hypothetical protein F3Y22_tig00014213pilonHSYRG00115 [Hibiscus syriacus]|uniref:Uncharacterized protein n=1 Tax=Hibiscus syriacus TaxID=106335 RepID=A0A6A3C4Y3_HIBSY|nr:hypothetical protein F3Y22_tig00014213pilonHSYRG00115 [Hibiscus syriacus]
MGFGRGLRAMRARLARERKVNRRVMQSLIASRVAAAEMEEQIRRIRQEMELQFQDNILMICGTAAPPRTTMRVEMSGLLWRCNNVLDLHRVPEDEDIEDADKD